jgi:hypothetical protein
MGTTSSAAASLVAAGVRGRGDGAKGNEKLVRRAGGPPSRAALAAVAADSAAAAADASGRAGEFVWMNAASAAGVSPPRA